MFVRHFNYPTKWEKKLRNKKYFHSFSLKVYSIESFVNNSLDVISKCGVQNPIKCVIVYKRLLIDMFPSICNEKKFSSIPRVWNECCNQVLETFLFWSMSIKLCTRGKSIKWLVLLNYDQKKVFTHYADNLVLRNACVSTQIL